MNKRSLGNLTVSEIGMGFAIRGSTAQNDRGSAWESATKWLSDSGY